METEKKKTRGRKITIIQLLLLTVAIVSIIFLANNLSENREISEIIVTGNSVLPTEEILTPGLRKIADTSRGSDIIFRISNYLKSNPFIADAFVSFQGSDKLLIELKEKQAAAIAVNFDGVPSLLCSDGTVMPYSHVSGFVNLPIVRNVLNSTDSSALPGAMAIVNALAKQSNQFIQQNISEIIYDNNKSFYLISSGFGIKIYFGTVDDVSRKLRKLSVFWEHEMPRIAPSKIKYVDVRWAGQVVVNIT